MKLQATIDLIAQYLQKQTKLFEPDDLERFTTRSISESLNLSRSVTSQYLNCLCKEKVIIKVNSRPVYFFHRKELEHKFRITLSDEDYLNVQELNADLYGSRELPQDFKKAIGCDGSLNYCITQIKSALLYPPDGLPMILYGEKGCGKSYLVQMLHEFLVNGGKMEKDAPFIKSHVTKNSKDGFLSDLFGYRGNQEGSSRKGLLELGGGGILYLKDAENLSPECQERLAVYLSTGRYGRVNEGNCKREAKTRIVLSIRDNPYDKMIQSLILNIPVICYVPNLSNRGEDEREEFILKFFREEQMRLEKPMEISRSVFRILMNYPFEHNIDELKKCIRGICANAYMESGESERVRICRFHLPGELMNVGGISRGAEADGMFMLDEYTGSQSSDKVIALFDELMDAYQACRSTSNSLSTFQEQGQKLMRKYYDFVIFDRCHPNLRLKAVEGFVTDMLASMKLTSRISLPPNCGFVLSRVVHSSSRSASDLRNWETRREAEIKDCIRTLARDMPDEYILAAGLAKRIETNLEVSLPEINLIYLMLNIRFYNKHIQKQDMLGIILAHGYSTASSIADAANTVLGAHLFEAIDMPLDTPVSAIVQKLTAFIEQHPYYKNLILMVDMGSLEGIAGDIKAPMNFGIINNISTALAVSVGSRIQQNYDLEETLRLACDENRNHYKIYRGAGKETAIVFTNDAGLKIAERICKLFKNSLPRNIDLKFMEYDYQELEKNGSDDILFKRYHVALLVKPYHLEIDKVQTVSLEDIINYKDIQTVNRALSPYLDQQEIEEFDKQLLKDFSLQSVMENLTILNANCLLDHVSEAVGCLQGVMKRKFQSKTIVGIYIHICFLVERLVTKSAIDRIEDEPGFARSHKDFIRYVNDSFATMLRHYNVEIPIGEIAYLYDYIKNDRMGGDEECQNFVE